MGGVCKMVGMREVARKANVSPGAVSRFLNQDKTLSISENTKQRIRAAVRDLNYDINKRKYEKAKIQSIGLISTIDRKKEIVLNGKDLNDEQRDELENRITPTFRYKNISYNTADINKVEQVWKESH